MNYIIEPFPKYRVCRRPDVNTYRKHQRKVFKEIAEGTFEYDFVEIPALSVIEQLKARLKRVKRFGKWGKKIHYSPFMDERNRISYNKSFNDWARGGIITTRQKRMPK
jgi:hypothetical protein